MASLMELVERVNKGEMVDPESLEIYTESSNSAEKFLAHHARAMLDLRRAHQNMLQSLEAIDYSDQKVLNQFVSVSGFLGYTDQRAQPVIRFGSSAIARREYAMGLEAIQNGVSYDLQHGGGYTSNRENCQFVAMQYERAAQSLGWVAPETTEWNNKQTRIAWIVSGMGDEEPSARTIRSLAKHIDSKRFRMNFYSTEAGVRRDKQQFGQTTYAQPSSKRGAATIEACSRSKSTCWMAPVEGDVVSAAREMASQLVKDRIDVAIFDATQADPIAALLANWEVARVRVNLCRRTPMYASGMNCITYFDQARYEADREWWESRNCETRFILEGIDIEEDLAAEPQRAAYGIPDQAIVLATSGADLDRTLSESFVDTVVNILRAHPQAVFLAVGDGELAWQKRKFESSGVGKRVGYAGRRKDLPGFLRIADLYLAEFPAASANGVLQAMAMERPVVAMRWGDSAEHSQAAAFVGSECTISARDPGAYIERVSKIIRDSSYRQKLGKTMRSRVEQHFGFNQTARHIEQLCEQLIQQRSESSLVQIIDESDSREPLAEVA